MTAKRITLRRRERERERIRKQEERITGRRIRRRGKERRGYVKKFIVSDARI